MTQDNKARLLLKKQAGLKTSDNSSNEQYFLYFSKYIIGIFSEIDKLGK